MKILVLSDSHSTLSFMRRCIESVKPDAVIHLGDHFDDAEAMQEAYPGIRFYMVPGNCDRYRCHPGQPEILINRVCGVNLYITHGHKHSAALYGHTHVADCHREEDGLWVLNPGSCGYFGGSAGLILADNGKIWKCCILREEDLLRSW